ncbi:PTS sugar transporter subunit IIA [Spiractinospora alimapuensis]|uniref:PTS sugar transporter subunit IIA n=1 Tax=Spiractinospora alimapuensis TaxID=2820884 RepID=UPI001F1AB924|nr:PTS sugar transporter subunit IIA [Spiractinospora alimapuensis]QVQ53837.1 PTS sugar transporter subunit IIA [Spiractinospora alimapuensis]
MGSTAGLAGVVTADTIRARIAVTSWEEAVRASGELLVRAGACEPPYVEAMEQAVRDLGPYIVLAPGVAMPHARPEAGVVRPGIAVVTLDTPVPFGHAANDPVDLVIPFAAVDKDAHLATLQRLVALLQDQTALDRVREATTDEELCTALGLEAQDTQTN